MFRGLGRARVFCHARLPLHSSIKPTPISAVGADLRSGRGLCALQQWGSGIRMMSSGSPLDTEPQLAPLIDFSDAKQAFSAKSTKEILRAYVVFKMCSYQWIVQRSDRILTFMHKVFGRRLTNAAIRSTFFGHFCAGESEDEIKPTVEFLRKNGIGGILDYAAEADIPEDEVDQLEADNPELPAVTLSLERQAPARPYPYINELECDRNVDIFLSGIRSVHRVTPEGFAAIKVTALGNPTLLERMSSAAVAVRDLFNQWDPNDTGEISRETFVEKYVETFDGITRPEASIVFDTWNLSGGDTITFNEWRNSVRLEDLLKLTQQCRKIGPLARAALSDEEVTLLKDMMRRLEKIAKTARELEVRLMIDAEQTYFQPAIDYLVLDLQKRFNTDFPTVFTTYQCYLKDSHRRVVKDLDRAKSEGYQFAAKLVRGAYMVSERARAAEMGYPDPIHPSIDATHANYHRCLEEVLTRRESQQTSVMVATHNKDTIAHTIKRMDELGIDAKSGGVSFGQLLGMADHLTFPLGLNGYNAYKYVPYGPIDEVLPYLIRRAQENSSLLGGGADEERSLLKSELVRRITGRR